MPKFLVLIYGDEPTWEAWTPEQEAANGERHDAFIAAAGPAVLASQALDAARTAKSVRTNAPGRRMVTDGPFVETKEVIGGFYLLEAADIDEAVELASQLPEASAPTSGIEVRPVRQF